MPGGRSYGRSERQLVAIVVAGLLVVAGLIAVAQSPLGHPAPAPRATATESGTPGPAITSASGGEARIQARIRTAAAADVAWSPDGERLLVQAGGVRVYDRWGSLLATAPATQACWLDDARLLTWDRGSSAASGAGGTGGATIDNLAITPLAGTPSPVQEAFRGPVVCGGFGVVALGVSPSAAGTERFAVLSAGDAIRVTPPLAGRPVAWSPDGRHLVFLRGQGAPSDGLYALGVYDYPDMQIVASAPGTVDSGAPFVWSPDGGYLAFASASGYIRTPADTGGSAATPSRRPVPGDTGPVAVLSTATDVVATVPDSAAPVSWGAAGLYFRTADPSGTSRGRSIGLWRPYLNQVEPTPLGDERAGLAARSALEAAVPTDLSPEKRHGTVELRGRDGAHLLDLDGLVLGPASLASTGDAVAVVPPGAGDILVVTIPGMRVGRLPAPVAGAIRLPQVAADAAPVEAVRVDGAAVLVAASGRRFVYARPGTGGDRATSLWLGDLHGTPVRLTDLPLGAAAAIDGQRVLWFDRRPGGWALMAYGLADRSRRVVASGSQADVPRLAATTATPNGIARPPIAADGDQVAYWAAGGGANGSIVVRSVASGAVLASTPVNGTVLAIAVHDGDVAWQTPSAAPARIDPAAGQTWLLAAASRTPRIVGQDGVGLGFVGRRVVFAADVVDAPELDGFEPSLGEQAPLFGLGDVVSGRQQLLVVDDSVVWTGAAGSGDGAGGPELVVWGAGTSGPVLMTGIGGAASVAVGGGYVDWSVPDGDGTLIAGLSIDEL